MKKGGGFATGTYTGLFDYGSRWFIRVAKALKVLSQRLRIEFCIGDAPTVLEQIRYDCVPHRQADYSTLDQIVSSNASGTEELDRTDTDNAEPNSGSSTNPETATSLEIEAHPRMYDRIHLSNIPDYTDGSLMMYLIALPLI